MIKYVLLFFLMAIGLTSCVTSKKAVRTHRPAATHKSHSTIVSEARKQLNRPYRYGGESPKGFDCSGLVLYVFDNNGVQLPRRSADQARFGKAIALGSARPGDLVFFKSGGRVNHVGIISNTHGKLPSIIHSSSSKGVIETDLDASDYWRKRFAFIRRP